MNWALYITLCANINTFCDWLCETMVISFHDFCSFIVFIKIQPHPPVLLSELAPLIIKRYQLSSTARLPSILATNNRLDASSSFPFSTVDSNFQRRSCKILKSLYFIRCYIFSSGTWCKPKETKLFVLQPFASYRLALLIKQVLKIYNYIVCPLKLFVLTLTGRARGAKTMNVVYEFSEMNVVYVFSNAIFDM